MSAATTVSMSAPLPVIVAHVRPFSNGTEGYDWLASNCERCAKNGEPDERGVGPCPMETAVSRGFILGTVPGDLMIEYGGTLSTQPGFGRMPRQCLQFVASGPCEYILFLPRVKGDRRKPRRNCGQPHVGTVEAHGLRQTVCETHAKGFDSFVRSPGATGGEA